MSAPVFGRKRPERGASLTRRIAATLLADPALLGLRTRRLLQDIRERFGCCRHVAADAVSLARRSMHWPVDSRGARA